MYCLHSAWILSVSGLVKEIHLNANICMVGQGKRKDLQIVNKAPRLHCRASNCGRQLLMQPLHFCHSCKTKLKIAQDMSKLFREFVLLEWSFLNIFV